ncbi:MAG: alanine racemase [Caldicoprobacterales bacterium]|jgi:alanine racemase|nr:alanine racemase [Clostridiales bacterium]
MRPTRAVINLTRFKQNMQNIKSLTDPDTAMMAVVKANAYGHGALQIAGHAVKAGAGWLGVAIPEEGMELRNNGISAPVLVLGGADREQCRISVIYNLTQAVPSLETAHLLNGCAAEYGRKARVHVKLDTGMGRIGFHRIEELEALVKELHSMKNIVLDGAFTHFAAADETDPAYTEEQIKRLDKMLNIIRESGIHLKWIHASNTAGVFQFPRANYNMVRCGIGLYGYYPSHDVMKNATVSLLPVMQWETEVVHIKDVDANSCISYGRTYSASTSRRVATLPVGYADGYNRLLSNRGSVLIHGKRAPVIGRVCMDQIMIDVTNIPEANIGSKVVLLGEQGKEKITADELADLCGTISYEILTSISERVPRIYHESN